MFLAGTFAKTILRSAHYIVAFKTSARPVRVTKFTATIVTHPIQRGLGHVLKSHTDQKPYAYMLLNLHPASRDDQRILCSVLKGEGFMHCYQFNMVVAKRKRQRRRKQRGGVLPLAAANQR